MNSPFFKQLNHVTNEEENPHCRLYIDLNLWQITGQGSTYFTFYTTDGFSNQHPEHDYLSKIHLHLMEMRALTKWLSIKLTEANPEIINSIYSIKSERFTIFFESILDEYQYPTFLIHVFQLHILLFSTTNDLIWLIEWANRMQIVVDNLL